MIVIRVEENKVMLRLAICDDCQEFLLSTKNEITLRSGENIPISRSCSKIFENIYFDVLFGDKRDFD